MPKHEEKEFKDRIHKITGILSRTTTDGTDNTEVKKGILPAKHGQIRKRGKTKDRIFNWGAEAAEGGNGTMLRVWTGFTRLTGWENFDRGWREGAFCFLKRRRLGRSLAPPPDLGLERWA
jgi:hypothetical protein